MNHHMYISVMGTMGSGKTTAAKLLAKKFSCHLLEENFGENAFLERFYNDMKRWAFHSQTFFLMEKITQMFETKKILTRSSIIQDTPIVQDVFSYAKAQHVLGNIDDSEWLLYQKIYTSFEPYFPKPNLIVYLETTVPNIISRIEKRARSYEQKIPGSYIELLDMLNHQWISRNTTIPVLSISTNELNIVRSVKAQTKFFKIVRDTLG